MPSLNLSRHALARANQRGVTHEVLNAFFAYADFEASVGNGRTVLRFTRERLMDRDVRDILGDLIDRLRSLALIIAEDTGRVITVLHDRGRAWNRRYRRVR